MTAPQIPLTDDQSRNLLIDIYLRGMEHGASTTAHLIWQGAPVPQSQFECSRVGHELMHAAADDPLVRMQLEQALCALLGLPNSAVSVVTGGK